MSGPPTSRPRRDAAYYALRAEVEEFFYDECELLDERRYDEWLELLTDDISYFMPMRRNVAAGQHEERENTREGLDISWFEDDKWTLSKRVEQIATGVHWAEEPLSRVSHLVTKRADRCRDTPTCRTPQEVTGAQPVRRLPEPGRVRVVPVRGQAHRHAPTDGELVAARPPRDHPRPERAAGQEPHPAVLTMLF